MALKDLIATPGEIAAARITKLFDYTGEAHERLFREIKEAVDGAAGFSPAPGKTAPAELVTEEMIDVAYAAFREETRRALSRLDDYQAIRARVSAALRAVAPMIAERAEAHAQHIRASAVRRADEHAREEEREACARIAENVRSAEDGGPRDSFDAGWKGCGEEIAAAIRARGETP